MTDKEIIIDDLDCNNCPEIERCKEQQKRKDAIIDTLLDSLSDTNNKKLVLNLKKLIPKITRCDVVLEKQLKRKEQECEELKNQWYFSTKHKLVLEFEYAFKLNKYKQALDEIEEYINSFPDFVKEADKINLDIIKKVKE